MSDREPPDSGIADARERLKHQAQNEATFIALKQLCDDKDRRIRDLEAELSDIESAYKVTINEQCAPDEKHCVCVPHLRKRIRELEVQLKTARQAIAPIISALDMAQPVDYMQITISAGEADAIRALSRNEAQEKGGAHGE